ncbi:hypothetical protein LTR27_005614 [Elasticomyces elasticus]|nr:hypothetical protein LTR27_005614 [Elasticomyces elasticus]
MTKRLDLGGMKAFVVFLAFSAIAHAAVPPDVTITFQTSSSMGSGSTTASGSPTAADSQTTTAAATTSSASLDQAAILSSLEAYVSSDQIADSSRDAEISSWRAQANRTLASSTPASASTAPKFEDMNVIDTMLLRELKVWAAFIQHGAEVMGNGTGMGNEGAYIDGQTSELATQLIEMCSDAKSYQALHLASLRVDDTVNLIDEKLNARFLQTAWSDQHCSLQCGPNPYPERRCDYREGDSSNPGSDHPELWCPSTKDGFKDICQAVCWQPSTDAGNVLLYGLNETAGRPWFLNNTDIFEASWKAYQLDSQGSYDLVSDAQMTAWTQYDSVTNTTITRTEPLPLLAVSWSEFISIRDPKLGRGQRKKHEIGKWTACNVGDRWGSDSKGFWNATHWDEMQDKNYLAFRCRNNLQEAMDSSGGIHKHPGIYLVTSLRLFAYVLWPGDDVKDDDKNLPQALKILDYADCERERLRKAGFSEEATEREITKVLCDKHGQYWMPLPSEDTSHDDEHEGSHETLDLVHENCPKWNKENL